MATHDPKVDAYIAKAQPFAQPILTEIRKRLHAAVPGLEEAIKWNAPFFLLDGEVFASMAGFKAHTKFLLWGAAGMSKTSKPQSADFAAIGELPPASAFVARIKEEAAAATARMAAPVAKKVVAKKTVPSKKQVVAKERVAVKKVAVKKVAVKKVAVKKVAAKKVAAKKK